MLEGVSVALWLSLWPPIRTLTVSTSIYPMSSISTAPETPGVTHVGGSFLESVPSGDAILLQHVLHNWGDEDCIKILKNCHQALLNNGKLLIVENVIDPARNSVHY